MRGFRSPLFHTLMAVLLKHKTNKPIQVKHKRQPAEIAVEYKKRQSAITIHLNKLWRRYMRKRNVVGFDVETTGLDTDVAEIFAFVFTWPDGRSEVWRIDTNDLNHNQRGWNRLQQIFGDGSYAVVAHNYKYELAMLRRHKIFIHPNLVWHDTMIMSRMLRNLWPSHALDYAPWVLSGYPKDLDFAVERQAKARGNRWDRVDKHLMRNYQIADGERTMLLFLTWIEEFTQNKPLYIDYIVEIELIHETLEMEKFGILLDWEESNKLVEKLTNDLDKLNLEVYEYLGEYVNLNSDPQLHRLFYKKFRFPVVKLTKKKKPATDKEAIKALKDMGYDDPILDMTLKWRTWSNALSMIQSYQELANAEGIIFPTINSCKAKTRRQSSENPNMQSISKKEKLDNPFAIPARKCFRARQRGLMDFVDYSGIEMRLIIDRAQSQRMIEAMRQGEHPHIIAAHIFYPELDLMDPLYEDSVYENCSYVKGFRSKKLDKILYDASKNGHFSLGYGASPIKVGKTLKFINPKIEGPLAYERYTSEFPEIANLCRNVARIAKETGYIELPFGCRLYIQIAKAYSALNYLIQGTAALILKRAEIMVAKYFRENWDNRVRLVLPIHDELVIHYPREMLQYREQIRHEVSALMVDIPEIEVPLEVEWKSTKTTWDAAKGAEINWNDVQKLVDTGCAFIN